MNYPKRSLCEQALILAVCIALTAILAALASAAEPAGHRSPLSESSQRGAQFGPIELLFSPQGGCQFRLQQCIAATQKSIRVMAYTSSNLGLAESLIAAHARGVDVQVVVDAQMANAAASTMPKLAAAGIPVFTDAAEKIQHQKTMTFDGQVVAIGSYNFSTAAEQNNSENLLIITDTAFANAMLANWQMHRAHSQPYQAARSLLCPTCPNGACPINPYNPPTQWRWLP